MEFLYVGVALLLALALGIPIYIVLGLLAAVMFYIEGTPLMALAQIYVDHLDSITLLAIPFFIISATFMQRGGIAQALVDWANAWVGRFTGGLGIVCVTATTIFAAISGSSVATAVAMGLIMVPAMLNQKYDRSFAVGLVGASGTLGILIPPSLAFIVFAIIAEESVPRLFLAGVIPGLIQAALFIAYSVWIAKRRNYPRQPSLPKDEFIAVNIRALPAIAVPVVILGGIYSGIVTVSESAGIAALVSIIVSVLVYKGCGMKDIIPIIGDSMKSTISIVMIIITALAFGHWLTKSGAPQNLADWVISLNLATWQFLIVINILFLVLGTFLEVFAIMLITLPILLPLLAPMGIDPIHFAVLMVINMELALLTPPIGLNIFVLSSITKTPVAETIKGVLPFMVILLILLIAVTYIPSLSLWLPTLIYG
ncbi:TRAP transporter large permease [Marinomonas sp.]|uniref:TRAP transporter large permease protein n=1 Tax=Marinomonas sp. (strain MWYL1) TaxID=400668 RepID=A6VRY3_MARMS